MTRGASYQLFGRDYQAAFPTIHHLSGIKRKIAKRGQGMPLKTKFTSLVAGSMALFSIAHLAFAEPDLVYDKVDGFWEVRVDQSLRGCYLAHWYAMEGTTLRIGTNMNTHSGYFSVGNTDWKSLKTDQTYKISVELMIGNDAVSTFYNDASVSVEDHGNMKVLTLTGIKDPKIIQDFARSNTIRFIYDREVISELSLPSTAAAVSSLLECQSKENQRRDPFAEKKVSSS
jgi:hypothetical protein